MVEEESIPPYHTLLVHQPSYYPVRYDLGTLGTPTLGRLTALVNGALLFVGL